MNRIGHKHFKTTRFAQQLHLALECFSRMKAFIFIFICLAVCYILRDLKKNTQVVWLNSCADVSGKHSSDTIPCLFSSTVRFFTTFLVFFSFLTFGYELLTLFSHFWGCFVNDINNSRVFHHSPGVCCHVFVSFFSFWMCVLFFVCWLVKGTCSLSSGNSSA